MRQPKPTGSKYNHEITSVIHYYRGSMRARAGAAWAKEKGYRCEIDEHANGLRGMYARTDCFVSVPMSYDEFECGRNEQDRKNLEREARRCPYIDSPVFRTFTLTGRDKPLPNRPEGSRASTTEMAFWRSIRDAMSAARTIHEHPEESRWMVYADWLDEIGDCESANIIRDTLRMDRYLGTIPTELATCPDSAWREYLAGRGVDAPDGALKIEKCRKSERFKVLVCESLPF